MTLGKIAHSLGIVRKKTLDAALAAQDELRAELAEAELKAAGQDLEKRSSLEAAFHTDALSGYMRFHQFNSVRDFAAFSNAARNGPRRKLEREISGAVVNNPNREVKLLGYCDVCEKVQPLIVNIQSNKCQDVTFREQAACWECRLSTRQRFLLAYTLRQCEEHGARIYAQEQVTDMYKALVKKRPAAVGSEYLGPGIEPGSLVDGIRHEDCMALSFQSESYDIVVSSDVLEHVASLEEALAELFRILAPGGKLIFTVPFRHSAEKTIRRAGFENGALVHYLEPVYHGNPVSGEGSLVFWDIGADIFDYLHSAGFSKVQIVCADSLVHGYYGAPLLFCADK